MKSSETKKTVPKLPERPEYPRPHFKREIWQPLNGEWEFEFDDAEDGVMRGLPSGSVPLKMKINVPFTYQTKASGIGCLDMHEVVWYKRSFKPGGDFKGRRTVLHFNAVDYECDVWINGAHAAKHLGGYNAFSADVTDLLRDVNVIVVRAIDRYDVTQPRGKQYWKPETDRCWYHGTTGIWQSVWIEASGEDRMEHALITTDIDKNNFTVEIETARNIADSVRLTVTYQDKVVKTQTVSLDGRFTKTTVELLEHDFVDEVHFWSPERPNLYYLTYELLKGGKVIDKVETYFGMRKLHYDGSGRVYLNNIILYQKLILDQGYWEDSDLTAPSAEALKEDILLAKAMGFNGARKHQKVEEAYFYHYADILGFLVWAEMPSAYKYNLTEVQNLTGEYLSLIKQVYNHPSVIAYVPINESWGARKILTSDEQKNFGRAMYYLTKAVDKTRLVSTNDGWECVEDNDLLCIHDYASFGDGFKEKYVKGAIDGLYPMWRKQMAHGEKYTGLPVIMSEFGGIALAKSAKDGAWGYGGAAADDAKFFERLASLVYAVHQCDFAGYCYTQLSDVKQEVNGLLDKYHKPKFNPEIIAAINRGEWTK